MLKRTVKIALFVVLLTGILTEMAFAGGHGKGAGETHGQMMQQRIHQDGQQEQMKQKKMNQQQDKQMEQNRIKEQNQTKEQNQEAK